MIGSRLTEMLVAKDYDVIILTRDASKYTSANPKISYANWNTEAAAIDADAIAKADCILNLAGANVAEKRWTDKRKKEIVESRTKAGALLVKALREIPNKVSAVINSSAIGWYGPDTTTSQQTGFTEDAPAANDFLGSTCRLWEESIAPVTAMGKRLVFIRTGIVLSNAGGAYKEFINPLRFGIAGIPGSGNQIMSWIHIDDICRIMISAVENTQMNGAYNAVAPKPVSCKELIIAAAKKIKGSFFIPVHAPAFALKILLGEMSVEVLKSTTVSADKIKNNGFQFLYPTIDAALNALKNKVR